MHAISTVLVVPCYNEAKRLDISEYRRFCQNADDVAILFVDDGSTDDTPDLLRRLRDHDPNRISVLTLPENAGKAEAVRKGILHAAQLNAEFVGFWDADLATPLDAVIQFRDILARHRHAHIVWGTRLGLLGRNINRHWLRRWLGRVFSTAAAVTSGLPIRDALCGAKLFRCGSLLNAVFATPFRSRWIFDVEILARARTVLGSHPQYTLRDVLYELPLDSWHERAGSRLKAVDFVSAAFELASLFLRYTGRRRQQPQLSTVDDKTGTGVQPQLLPFLPRPSATTHEKDERIDAA